MTKSFNYMVLATLLAGLAGSAHRPGAGPSSGVPVAARSLPSFSGATGWLNSQPLTEASLRGNVVLVEFWTYTCVNWRRTLPYVRTWAEKYKEQGLVVIGVHTPEFSFEKNADNVKWAVKDMKILFPVATDNDYAVWRAFDNEYWPALYFIDAKGRIRHTHFGEGSYDQSEKVIQQLLAEAGAKGISSQLTPVDPTGAETAADWRTLQSSENYLGYERTANFASPGGAIADQRREYIAPTTLRLNQWALMGNWTMGKEADVVNERNGRLRYRWHARDVNLIMGPAAPGNAVRFRVLIDGKAPGAAHGDDVDEEGNGTLKEQRIYQLIRQPSTIADREFEIVFLDAGAAVFDFTFG
ncbi:MAG: thioredoxin family protein [Bacteroidetes bacterium]|nr:thioredoxin family protein [Bacteroidota bacterium]